MLTRFSARIFNPMHYTGFTMLYKFIVSPDAMTHMVIFKYRYNTQRYSSNTSYCYAVVIVAVVYIDLMLYIVAV